jgi:hypothetical protein
MNKFANRVIRAMRFESSLYEEVEADRTATGQAMAVVILASIAGGIGTGGLVGLRGVLFISLAALGGWVVWALITYIVGTKILPTAQTRSNPGELLRTLGFANSPGLLSIFGLIPVLGGLVKLVVPIWILIAWVIAVRQALDYTSTGRAIAVCLLGWLLYVLIVTFVYGLLGGIS